MSLPPPNARGVSRSRTAVATSPAACGHPPLTLALSVAAAFSLPALALAQSTGLQAIHGAASVATQGNKTVITTQNGAGTSHSALNWQSFGVAPGTVTQFNQPSAASTSINRVLGNNPSAIFGTLSSNGKLVLVNPAGIAVGAGAVVDTAGFTASTLRMTDADALAGRLVFGDGGIAGGLSVNGHIVARGGDVVLIAPDVQTGAGAVIESPNGATILAAGRKVEVTGRGLEGIRLEVQAPEDKAVNLGQLKGDAVGIFAGTLKHSGLVKATAVSVEGGKVVLKGRESADIDGTVTAQKGSLGGQIHATANKVKLKSGAVIDASGAAGGGEVLIGGGWQGKDARLANAQETTAEAGATINADAAVAGHGGTVVLWSDGDTYTRAQVTARGGIQAGNGGKLETSGKRFLDADTVPQLNARATGWSGGEWLLDPQEIVIGSGTPPAPAASPNVYTGANAGGASYIAASTIESALNTGTSVTVQTSGPAAAPAPNETRIRVNQNITKSAGGAATLTLLAHENVQVDNGVTISSGVGALNLNFKSGWSADASTASSTGGSIVLGTGSSLGSNGGTIALTGIATASTPLEAVQASEAFITSAGGAITLNGTHASVNRRGVYLDRTSINSGAGAITIGSTTSNVKLVGSSVTSTGGNITLSSVGSHNYSALEIVDYLGPPIIPSMVSTIGSGSIALTGEQTGFGSSAGSYAGGVVINNSTVSSFNGSVTLLGKVGVPSGVAQVSRGFSLETGARITSNGVVSLTGEVGASASANSHGGVLASGATVASTGGGVSLSGTLNNASISAGTGLTIGGRVQASGLITLNGSATVGNMSGTGLDIQAGAVISSTALGVTATGSVSSSTTATNLVAASIAGTISTTSAINVTGAVSAPSAVNASGVVISGVITGTNSGNQLNITGSGVPPPSPTSSREIYIQGGTVSSTGGQIKLAGDRIELAGVVNSSTGRTMIVPTSTNREIVLAGSNETNALNLTSSEINSITASALVIGGSTYNGGITISGNIAPANTNTLSLINEPTGANGISQSGSTSITVNNLNADARYVSLPESGNSIGTVSGRNYAGTFDVRTSGALTIGTVDGVAGLIASTTGGITAQAGGVITINGDIFATSSSATLTGGGITLNSTRTINAGGVSLNAGGGVMSLGLGSISSTGSVQLTNGASTTLGAISALAGGLSLTNITGAVTQNVGTSVTAGLLSGSGNSGLITLANSGNDFTSIGTLSTTAGGLTVVDGSGNLNISGVVSAPNGIINIRTPGSINQSQQVTSGAAGNSIVLSAGANYFNTAGSTGLLATHGSGRWLVYLASPAGNNFGSLASTNSAVWNSTYALNLPATIDTGNRYVFANQPTATITANAQTREYDGNTMFAPVTHTVSGLVNASTYGNVFSQDILTGSLSVTAPGRNVGTYAIGIGTLTAPTGYAVNFTPANATVTAKALTINAVTDSRVYNGTTSSVGVPTFVGLVGGDTLTGLSQTYASKNVLGANNSVLQVSGGYTLGDGNGGLNYTVTTNNAAGTITPAALTVSTSSVNRQYDSTLNAAGTAIHTVGTLYAGDTLSGGTFAFVSKNVGTNVTVNASGITVNDGNSGNNYTLTHVANNTSNITAAPLAVSGVTASSRVYDGTAVATLGGTASVSGFGGDVVSVSGTGAGTFANKHVGTAKAVSVTGFGLSGADAGNYLVVQPVGVTADITQRAVTIRPNDITRVYDGTTGATGTLLVTSGSIAVGDSPLGGTFSFADRHVGTGKTVNLSGLTINDGNGGNNYTLTQQANTNSTITAANLAVTGVTASNRAYDGTTVASLGGSATVAALGGDTISVTGTGSGSFVDRHAGNGKAVTVSGYSLSGANAGNYVLLQPTGVTANITPAALTVSTSSVNKVYDATTSAAGTAIVTGGALFGSDTISGGTFQFVSKNAGSNVTVNVSGVAVNDGNAGGNYTVTHASNNTSNISQANLAVTGVTATSRVYDGTTVASLGGVASVAGLGADVVSVLGAGSGAFADRHVGSAKAVTVTGFGLTGADAGNYAIVQPTGVTANITPANLTVTGVTANNKVYDASTVATLGGSATVAGLGGDVVSVTGTGSGAFASKGVGSAKPVTVTGYSLTGANAGNYVVVQPVGVTANITPASLTVSGLSGVNRVYDATTNVALAGAATLGGVLGADVVNATNAASGTFASKNVGSAKTISTTIGLGGADAGNYTLVQPGGLTADVTPATLAVTGLTANNRVYDAGTAAPLSGTAAIAPLGADVVTLTGGATASFADRHAGNAKPVTVTGYGITGTDAGNYILAQPTGLIANITPASLTLSAVSDSRVYDGGTSSSGTVAVAGVLGSDSITGVSQRFASRNVMGTNGSVMLVNGGYAVNDGNGGANYLVTTNSAAGTITPAALTVGIADVTRVYNGTTDASATPTVLAGALLGGDNLTGGTFAFTDRHVGTGKTVNVSGVVVNDGNGGNNYTLTQQANTASTINVRPTSTWTGAAMDGLWSNPGNWDALPDASNVLAVTIPAASSLNYDLAGTTILQSITSAGNLGVSNGTLNIGNTLSTAGYSQTGGTLAGAGSLVVSNSFARTGGSINMGGNVSVTQAAGNLVAGGITASAVSLSALSGHITQNGAIHTTGGLVTAQAQNGIALNDAGNQFAALHANNTASGDIDVVNGVALDLQKAVTASGNVVVVSSGGVSTSGQVAANGGTLSLTSNSPLTIGASGVSANGNITLAANNAGGNMLLNGNVSSSTGSVTMNASGTLTQNAAVNGPTGVTATAGGAITFGAGATTSGTPQNYTAAGTPVTPPAPAPAPSGGGGAPPPAPAPSPAAAPAPSVDAIVALLNTDSRPAAVTRAEIAEVIQQVDNTVTQFVALLIKEEAKQEAQADDKKKKDEAKDKEAAAVTDTQCKPGA